MSWEKSGDIFADAEVLVIDESRSVDIICAMAWKSVDGTINIESILRRMGMTPQIEIPGYWNQMVNSPGGHDCPVCGRPCKCSAVLYFKEIKQMMRYHRSMWFPWFLSKSCKG